MKIIYHPIDILEAQMLSSMLDGEGIPATVNGLNLIGAVGELPPMNLLTIAVTDEQADKAIMLIQDYSSAQIIEYDNNNTDNKDDC